MNKNDSRNVSTAKGVAGGYFFSAPEGTPVPTDWETSLEEVSNAYECLGYVGEDGWTEGVDGGSEDFKDANGDIVDSTSEPKTETLQAVLIEMSEASLGTQYGHENVKSGTEGITVDHNWSKAPEERVYVADLVLKNGRRWRKVVPRGKVTEVGEVTINSTTLVGRQVTVKYLTDEEGSGAKDYIQPLVSAPKYPEGDPSDSWTKAQLLAWCSDNDVDGVSESNTKDQILAAIAAAQGGE